jgi:hypothetical protein
MQRSILCVLTRAYPRVGAQLCQYSSSKSGNPPPLSDPYPLPLSKDTLQANNSPNDMDESPPPPSIPRPNESLSSLQARLVYQTRKRGTLESDLLLSTFAKEHLPKMSEKELKEFDKVCLHFNP